MTKQKMDHQVDKMKLSKYGCSLNLLWFSSILSLVGIVVSIAGIVGGIAAIMHGSKLEYGKISILFNKLKLGDSTDNPNINQVELGEFLLDQTTMYVIGGVILLFMTPNLFMWIILMTKTYKQDIPGIEQIVKVYSYVSGSLESVITTFLIMLIIYVLVIFKVSACTVASIKRICQLEMWFGNSWDDVVTLYIIASIFYLGFACQKMDAIRTKKIRDGWKEKRVKNDSKMLGTYVALRYALFVLSMIFFIILNVLAEALILEYVYAGIVFIIYFVLDIGLSVILHGIWVDRKNTDGSETEKTLKNK